MGILGDFLGKLNNDKAERDNICKEIDAYIMSIDAVFEKKTGFIDNEYSADVKKNCSLLIKKTNNTSIIAYIPLSKLNDRKRKLTELSAGIITKIAKHNDVVAGSLAGKAKDIIGNVEEKELDFQQLKCIVKPMPNHLVIAGAGTGKTTTIVGKVKYLLNSGACEAKDILVLSFTNASASEMRDRINKETGQQIEASTFHKLGINIIKAVNGITPKLTQIQLQSFSREKLNEYMKDPQYLDLLCRYFLFNHKYNKSEFDFQNSSEYEDYLRTNPPVTLKGDRVKSYGEMDIANFLYSNGISYEYEKEYEYDTRTADRAQYYPDFYLADYGYYIEYFGINEKGEVPDYFTSRDGKTPSEEYLAGMDWKRKLHKNNKTVLIECYSYERSKGILLSSLEDKLRKAGVAFKPITPQEMWGKISERNSKNVLTGIVELFSTVISLMKSNEYDPEQLRQICRKSSEIGRNTTLIDLIAPIYNAYVDVLKANGEIDFNDMINDAARMVRDGKYVNPYKYVIVDEYQDISKSRYNLLKALRESSNYNLFCVGDDWQSIYRFTGSDLDYILHFSKYWGATEYSKIETTYRFTDSLIDISGKLVMKNPAQIKKTMRGIHSKLGFAMGEIKAYTEELAIKFMLSRLRELPQNNTVFFIGRYSFDNRMLSNCPELEFKYDNATQVARVILPDRKDLDMHFLTAHKSKGLQADYVFIINNKDRGMGFPSKIQDDPLVDCLLEGKESFPFAEERRLFYVALTRAKYKSYLLVVSGNESEFASEMEMQYADEMKKEAFTCPLCGASLERKSGPYGEFYGCSNYPITGCEFTRKIFKKQSS